jgi:hypothetical protein
MRTKVRNFTKDTNATPKMSNEELDDYIAYALADYSRHFPRQMLLVVDPPTATASLPDDAVPDENSVDGVEVSSVLWSQWKVQEGQPLPVSGKYWYWRGGVITFPATPSGAITVWYRGLHPMPVEVVEDEEPAEGAIVDFTVPVTDQELIVTYSTAKFHEKMGTVAAKLDRFKERGERDDNPLVLMHEVLFRRYHDMVGERLRRGTIRLRRS